MGSGYVSHCWTSSFDDHFDDNFIVFKNVQQSEEVGEFFVCSGMIGIDQFKIISGGSVSSSWCWFVFLIAHCRTGFPGLVVTLVKSGNTIHAQPCI